MTSTSKATPATTLSTIRRIAFLGGGNMAQAMIGGLLKSSLSNSLWSISVAEPYEPTRQRLAQLFPGSLLAAVANSTPELLQLEQQQEPSLIPLDAVVLAVKPQTVAAVCGDIKAHLLSTTTITTNTPPLLVISIAAGVSQASIAKWLDCSGDGGGAGAGAGGRQAVVVRCMPNTPALVNQGATGLFSPESSLFSPPLKSLTESILRSVSPNALYWLTSENLIDVVTGLSGSGPAYFFLVIEALTDAAVKLGLPKDVARGLATQTCLGAGTMAMSSYDEADAAELRRRVTSPNGTTEAGIRTAESMDVRGLFQAVVEAATKRSAELGAEMAASKIVRERLEAYHSEVATIVLSKQNAATGLIPASVAITTHGNYTDAWVRDNVYSILCVWALSLAYKRIDDGLGRAAELELATVKCMRGLLVSMLRQADKVEQFKSTQELRHALHAKYNTQTGATVVGDFEWGHLQIDATSLFLLMLAQMTVSGLQIIYTMDEVHFIQNLVFYIERAYRTPDYGIWERGNKINHGQPELNSSSIGMAVAALQAINGINLFGARGGPSSVIHVLPDEITRNWTTLHSTLPRESYSKEVDAAVLSVISFPAFAVSDPRVLERTRNEIVKKLGGRFGCKRFWRDGHQTVLEDTSRLHYDPQELTVFEKVESEWPLFFTYLILDGIFFNKPDQVAEYRGKLEPLLVDSSQFLKYNRDHHVRSESGGGNMDPSRPLSAASNYSLGSASAAASPRSIARKLSFTKKRLPPANMRLVPELYIVPRHLIDAERANPGSQDRLPNENVPLVWAQSLKIVGDLLIDGLITPAELDPLGRRLNVVNAAARSSSSGSGVNIASSSTSSSCSRTLASDVVVQVVLLAESADLQAKMAMYGLETQTLESCAPITISHPSALRDAYTALGENPKLGLTGRPKRPIGTLSTCKLYRCQGRLYAFLPHFMDREEFYLVSDNDYLVTLFEQELLFVKNHWTSTGRPTMLIMLTSAMIGGPRASAGTTTKLAQTASGGIARVAASRSGSTGGGGGGGGSGSKRNLLNFMMSLRSGLCGGVRVRLGRLTEMVNTACIQSLDFLVSAENSDYEDWHSVLKGEEPVGQDTASNAMNRLNLSAQANTGHYPVQAPSASSTTNQATTPTNPSGTLGRRTGVVRKASGDYSSNPKSADSSFSSTNTRSPLTSSFYTEDPSLYAELKLREERHQLDINYLHPADTSTGSAAANRPASPVRGVASNRHVKGVFTEHENAPDEVSFRRASYSFDVLPVDNLNGALLVGGGDLQKPASAATPASLLAPGAGSVDGVKQYVGAANNYAPPFKHSALGLGGDGRDYADYTVDTTMLTLTLNDPTHVAEAVTLLHNSSNLYDQIDVLHYLLSCHGGDFYVQGLGIVTDLLEEVYVKAMQLKQWSIVRQAAGLLKKMVNSLSINVTDLLIRQKPVTVGFGKLEFFISSPKNPAKLAEIIYQHCISDVREAPLVQEVLTYLGSFIRSSESTFEGIMRVRTHFFIIAMREEISRMKGCDEEEAVEYLMQLSPFEMKSLLGQVLNARDQTSTTITASLESHHSTAMRWKQIQVSNIMGNGSGNAGGTVSDLLSATCENGNPLPDQLVVVAQSGGFQAGNFARIEMNRDGKGQRVPGAFSRGLNVVVMDPLDGGIIESAGFDTHMHPEDSDEFAKLIEWLEPGMLVVLVSKDDCSENLTEAAKVACESLGSTMIRRVEYRDSWCLVGEKGATSASEAHKSASLGPTESITKTFDLAARRKKVLSTLPTGGTAGTANKYNSVDLLLSTSSGAATNVFLPSNGRWLRRRKNDGALNRAPPDFYPKVWKILSKCRGILIGKEYLPSEPTINEKTPEEFNFALQVESTLDVIRDPAERQIAIECLSVIWQIYNRNPEMRIKRDTLDLIKVIRDAVFRHWQVWVNEGKGGMGGLSMVTGDAQHHVFSDSLNNSSSSKSSLPATPATTPASTTHFAAAVSSSGSSTAPPSSTTTATISATAADSIDASFERNERFARRLFFDLPQDGPDGTMSHLASSCVKLVFEVEWNVKM